MRHSPGGDRLAAWPTCLWLIVRRTPRPVTKPAKLSEDLTWEYDATSPSTAT